MPKNIIQAIEAELKRLDALCDSDQPCLYCVTDEDEDCPAGLVRIYDDWSSFNAEPVAVLKDLHGLPTGTDYDEIFTGWNWLNILISS